jgi:hypothetical protein
MPTHTVTTPDLRIGDPAAAGAGMAVWHGPSAQAAAQDSCFALNDDRAGLVGWAVGGGGDAGDAGDAMRGWWGERGPAAPKRSAETLRWRVGADSSARRLRTSLADAPVRLRQT